MYKDKQIIFKQRDEKHVDIYMKYEDFRKDGKPGFEIKEKKIGQIFTESYANAIQVCGFSEAFDYWGCGVFAKPKVIPNGSEHSIGRQYYHNAKGKKIMEQTRDIQLYFDDDTVKASLDSVEDCMRCYNTDCTCENERGMHSKHDNYNDLEKVMDVANATTKNPFNLKRTSDITQLVNVKERENRKKAREEADKKK